MIFSFFLFFACISFTEILKIKYSKGRIMNENIKQIDSIIERHSSKASGLIMILQDIQASLGYLAPDSILRISEKLKGYTMQRTFRTLFVQIFEFTNNILGPAFVCVQHMNQKSFTTFLEI